MKKKRPLSYAGSADIRIENADLIVCRCEEVMLGEILKAITDGAVTVNEVKKRTRAGMGLCQGKTCGRLVQKLICEHAGKKPGQVEPGDCRPPVRPLKISALDISEDIEDDQTQ